MLEKNNRSKIRVNTTKANPTWCLSQYSVAYSSLQSKKASPIFSRTVSPPIINSVVASSRVSSRSFTTYRVVSGGGERRGCIGRRKRKRMS